MQQAAILNLERYNDDDDDDDEFVWRFDWVELMSE